MEQYYINSMHNVEDLVRENRGRGIKTNSASHKVMKIPKRVEHKMELALSS